MFAKILIANRGEIAVRIIRACKEMGIQTVAVYSEADRDSLHVNLADESYCIGPAAAKDSYLNMAAILSVADLSGAEAIHPGYGLLSENAKFAELCQKCGIAFIGPAPEVISKMGDKEEARKTMIAAGVPVIPGSEILPSLQEALENAERIGYPLLIKARAGGGGRGIRIVNTRDEVEKAYHQASSEALSAFGDGGVYMEKRLAPVKHVEVQIIADQAGHVVALGERDCSVQRKNQKLVEESPCAVVSPELRRSMCDTAVKAAASVNYTGVGTIEFLLDQAGNFYFMEMNTRLQVEHPVTEFVTGYDLVKWQIRIAAGRELDFTQEDVTVQGCAIECRINADQAAKSASGVTLLHIPGGPWVRFDTAIYQDYKIPPFYDSMIGKLIVYSRSREESIRKMKAALGELVIEGVENNIQSQIDILSDPDFVSGNYYTNFMERYEK
ncbi:MAG TPA: acetyl-CoA carboxylase biotin carboxylase subunit [Candidatus Egerieisoma faecipullorum]|uniref:Biotin carboxylase n=1 Tax=Candidatus Egerieisoma faecipullorum TaxID=2840963 RepID=A0A9D1I8I4_9CLOT|nr:acetyl-CoA carboxylase biotin carboxylase subunit [Candidatus Egerieisoma faecipullorum]